MAVICPTITASEPHEYRAQMELLQPFAKRIHIDLMDGKLAPTVSVGMQQVWWPEGIIADMHLMYQQPLEYSAQVLALRPNLVVVHAEADGDLAKLAVELHQHSIKAGLALLPDTSAYSVMHLIPHFDHAMVFGGKLGYHGGTADLSHLDKVKQLRQKFPHLEIGWDGGVSDQNVAQLVAAGVDVLNTGGFIHRAESPQAAYEKLAQIAG